MLPTGVSPEAAQLLERAYALDSDEKSRALYRDWAETYDETMLTGLNYLSPGKVADLLAQHLADRQAAVLDIGCGTGLGGQGLAGHGFVTIDGLDVSPEMMQVAGRRGVYRRFVTADLNLPLDCHRQLRRRDLLGYLHPWARRRALPRRVVPPAQAGRAVRVYRKAGGLGAAWLQVQACITGGVGPDRAACLCA